MVFQYAILNLRSELATTIHEASIYYILLLGKKQGKVEADKS